MIISRKELLEAAENGTPILNHLDELTEDAMKAIFFERVPICEGSSSTKPLISPSKERVLTEGMNMSFTRVSVAAAGKQLNSNLQRPILSRTHFPFIDILVNQGGDIGKHIRIGMNQVD